MKKLLFVFLIIISGSSIAQAPKVATKHSCKLKIGDVYQGGIVFYIDASADGCHGILCAPSDQATGVSWGQAVTLCKSLKLYGFSTWELPGPGELNLMYTNLYIAGLGHFSTKYYWSSKEEFSGVTALGKIFAERSMGGGQVYGAEKNNAGAVRAIRYF